MRTGSVQLGRLFSPSLIRRNRYFTPHLQQANYLLPFVAGACCSVEDARRLFARFCGCYHHHLAEGADESHGDDNSTDSGAVLEESVMPLQRLGLISFTNEEQAVRGELKVQRIYREPIITINLHSINVTSSQRGEEETEALFQILHGVIIPLMFSRLASSSAVSSTSRSPRFEEEVSAQLCFSLLQQSKGTCSKVNDTTCRFIVDLVDEALLLGVRERILFPCGGGLFRLHRDMTQRVSPCLLTFQWWWWRRVDSFLRRVVASRAAGKDVASEATIDAAQERVRYWIKRRDEYLPHFLLHGSMDDTMALVADAVRCWFLPQSSVQAQKALSVPKWRLHLSDEAKVSLALETLRSIRSCLVRRPAGISLDELSTLIAWSTLSSLLQKKSILKTLNSFPSNFVVNTVQGVTVAQLQLCLGETNTINATEARTWVLGRRNESSDTAVSFLQEVDFVVRSVLFLRKRHLLDKRVTFEDLHAVLLPEKEMEATEVFLDVLRRYDVVTGFGAEGPVSWLSLQQERVCLSVRESVALKAIEAFRKRKGSKCQLYAEAISPFLSRCSEEATTAGISDTSMPIAVLERWLQCDRLSLNRADLFEMLRECSSPFVMDEKGQSIYLGRGNVADLSQRALPPSPADPMTSTLPPPPPPLPTTVTPLQKLTFDSRLSRVLKKQNPDALFRFAEATIHAVFGLIFPLVSVPSGVRLQNLLRRVRWGSVAGTLGALPSFLEAFDGLFFDMFVDTSGQMEDVVVTAYRGHVGAWLLYARLISRLFPTDVNIPLRLIAEGLSWGVWFAPRFGDLSTLLRRVGRSCREGYLLAKNESTVVPSAEDDAALWEILENVRREEKAEQQPHKGLTEVRPYLLVKPTCLIRYMRGNKEADGNGDDIWMHYAETAIRRFPLFFQWNTASQGATPLLRIALKSASAPDGLAALVEEYVCPLLRQRPQDGTSIAELDDRLGWSRGNFDTHPASSRVLGVVASGTSLYGILQRYVEAVDPPRILLQRGSTRATEHESVMVRPNTCIYRSPEDMLLEVNGLEYMTNEDATLRPSGRPVSLFELLAEEQELQGGENISSLPRTEEWHVSLQCNGEKATDWEEELANGRVDVLVWCES
ncbi:hypothetical protein MOQ_003255 [Trypanosoma cruzi marinkellei]|uniref:Uncharacterized protein n=1 Tax=Trypanosoma cruzi marinkellei TaxID=85056 RepID=K2NV85_TRYCR|nr:hypothetical protein MOQ_003255 [Trypanosoma cruzi marinkellei]